MTCAEFDAQMKRWPDLTMSEKVAVVGHRTRCKRCDKVSREMYLFALKCFGRTSVREAYARGQRQAAAAREQALRDPELREMIEKVAEETEL